MRILIPVMTLFAAFLFATPILHAQSNDITCIPDVVIDLDGECWTLVTPSMVLSDFGSVPLDQLKVNIQYEQTVQSKVWQSSYDEVFSYEVVCVSGDCSDFTSCSGTITVEPPVPVAICDSTVEVLLNYETPLYSLYPRDIAEDSYMPCYGAIPLYWWWEYPDGTIGMEWTNSPKEFRVEDVGIEMTFYVEIVNFTGGPADTCSVVIVPQMIDSLECGPAQIDVGCLQEPPPGEAVFLNAPPYHYVESLPVTNIGDNCLKRELHQTRVYNTMMYDSPEEAVWDTCTQEVTHLISDNTVQKIYIPGEDLIDQHMRWNNKIRTFFSCQDTEVSRNDSLFSYDPNSNIAVIERTLHVKDLCRYDGVSEPVRLSRDVDCNGIEGDQDYYILYSLDDQIAYLDSSEDFNDDEPTANMAACNNPAGYYEILDDYNGFFEYIQLHTVNDFADLHFTDFNIVPTECGNDMSLAIESDLRTTELYIQLKDTAILTIHLDYFGDGTIDDFKSPKYINPYLVEFDGVPAGSHIAYAEYIIGEDSVAAIRDTLFFDAYSSGSNYQELDCVSTAAVFLTEAPGISTDINNFLPYEALSDASIFCSADSYTLEYSSSLGTLMSGGVYFDDPIPDEVTITVQAIDESGVVMSECSISVILSQSGLAVTIPDTTFMPEDTLCLPVVAKNFGTVLGFSFPLSYNANHLSFEEIRNTTPLLPSFNPEQSFGNIIGEDSLQNIRILHIAPDLQLFDIPDSIVLFEACFTPIVSTNPCTSVGFEDYGDFFQVEFIDNFGQLIPANFNSCQAQLASQLLDTLCTGESLMINNQLYDQNHPEGTELIPGTSCDSTLMVHLQFLPNDTTSIEAQITPGETFQVGSETFSETGNYEILLTNRHGCDSLIYLDLDLLTATEEATSTLSLDEWSLQQLLDDAPTRFPENELRLFDALGRQVYLAQPYQGQALDFSQWPSGIYYYSFRPSVREQKIVQGKLLIAQ